MSQGASGFGLPLMHHLVKQRAGGPGPSVALQMSMREGDFRSLPRSGGGSKFSQAPAHPAGQPDDARPQTRLEVPGVEPGVEGLKPGERCLVLGTGSCHPERTGPFAALRRTVSVHRESDEDPLRQAAVGAASGGPGPFRNSGNHVVWGGLIPAVDPERTAARQADQDSPVGMEDHRNGFGQAMGVEPDRQDRGHEGFIRP